MTTTTTTTAGNHQTVTLDEGQALNILPDSAGTGTAYLMDNTLGLGNSTQSWSLSAGLPLKVGPFSGTRRVRIVCATGTIAASAVPAVLNQAPGGMRDVTASDTVTAADINGLIRYISSSPGTITIPNDVTGGFSANEFVPVVQYGTGAVSFVAGFGVTLRSPAGVAASTQYGPIAAMRIGPNEWTLV